MSFFLLPILLSGSSAPAPESEEKPVEGQEPGQTVEIGATAEAGSSLLENPVGFDNDGTVDSVYTLTDDAASTGLQRSGRLHGDASLYTGAQTTVASGTDQNGNELTGPITVTRTPDAPLVENTRENSYAKQISKCQNLINQYYEIELQDPQSPLFGKQAQFPPLTVDGAVGDEDVARIRHFSVYLGDEHGNPINTMTKWGVDGFSKEMIAELENWAPSADVWVAEIEGDSLEAQQYDAMDMPPDVTDVLDRSEWEHDYSGEEMAGELGWPEFDTTAEAGSAFIDTTLQDDDSLEVGGEYVTDWQPGEISQNFLDNGSAVLQSAYRYDGADYGNGRGQFDCVTFVERVLKDNGYDLDHKQMMCIVPGNLSTAVSRGDACTQGAPKALIDSGQGYAVDREHLSEGCVIQYWYKDRDGNLRGHAGIVKGISPDGQTIELYGAHASKGGVDSKTLKLYSSSIVAFYAAMPTLPVEDSMV